MIGRQFKLSQPERERLIRVKAKTGVQSWSALCRWALCWSLAEPSVPAGTDPLSDSSVELDWPGLGGAHSEIYAAILRQRCLRDGLGDDDETLLRYFRLHLNRGINPYRARGVLKNCTDLLRSACAKEEG